MILAKFRHKYPQGSLVSELVEIDRGTYIVKALVQIDNIVLSTGLAGADTVEAAEDAAKERAIATLFLDHQPDPTQGNLSQTNQTITPRETPEMRSTVSEPPNVNFSKAQPPSVADDQPLTPVTVPLKPVTAVANSELEPETMATSDPELAPANNLFGDTFTAQTPSLELALEDNSDPTMAETNTNSEELEAMSFNEIKQKTDIEIKRLNWTKDRGKEFLMSRYGKKSRLHLTDEQLLEFLRYLETLPNPIR